MHIIYCINYSVIVYVEYLEEIRACVSWNTAEPQLEFKREQVYLAL